MGGAKMIWLRKLCGLVIVLVMVNFSKAAVVTFEDLNLPVESYWNGSDGSGGFASGDAKFYNIFYVDWASWEGFSYSNVTDNVTYGLAGQYNAVTGAGQGDSSNYAVCSVLTEPPTIKFKTPCTVNGLYVTNNNYAYYSMLNGDAFAKKFGGESGDEPDFYMLTVTGKDSNGIVTDTVDFYLADFRFDDSNEDYILDTWEYVDLTSLGTVRRLEFALSSSDTTGGWLNTPAYFALDSIEYQLVSIYTSPYTEAGVNGYIDPNDKWRQARPDEPNAIINPIFRGWATEVVSFNQAPGVDPQWSDPDKALGPATGNGEDIFSLGDLSIEQLDEGILPGQITLTFDEPILDGKGYEIVVFENGLLSQLTTAEGSMAGQMFAELAYVEVSSNGEDYVRFPAVSLTSEAPGLFGTIDIDKVYNLAGKHPNGNGICTGTPFDLAEVGGEPNVIAGLVDINDIRYVRIVDIPGTGDFHDDATRLINPDTWPDWDFYSFDHPVYDAWNTSLVPLHPSGGFDLEAVGVLKEQQLSADVDLNGIVDESDLAILESAWNTNFGQPGWIGRCDLAKPKDMFIDESDLEVLNSQWLQTEQWRD
jgi:hypothetical protein